MRVLLVGDIHGNSTLLEKAITKARKVEASIIIQVGDFGLFPNLPEFEKFILSLKSEIPFYFLDGNHENHSILDPYKDCETFVPLNSIDHSLLKQTENFFFIPRCSIVTWGETTLLFIGGANSIDRYSRTEGIDWFPSEGITSSESYYYSFKIKEYLEQSENDDENEGLNKNKKIDILISHESANPDILGRETPNQTRGIIKGLFEQSGASLNIHGHHHNDYVYVKNGLVYQGLGCREDNMFQILDL